MTATARLRTGGRALVVARPGAVHLEPVELAAPGAGEVVVRVQWSLMNAGVDRVAFNGTSSGEALASRAVPGHGIVGEVQHVGAGVGRLEAGELVAYRREHASHHLLRVDGAPGAGPWLKVPSEVDPRHAAWFAVAQAGFRAARATGQRLGDDVLVVGAGPLGQMVVRWLRAAGARRIVVVDPFVRRLRLAADAATRVVEGSVGAHGPGALVGDLVPTGIVDATGDPFVATALAAWAPPGVCVVDAAGRDADRHDEGEADRHDERIGAFFLELLASGRINVAGLNTHVFAPEECQTAYELPLADRGGSLGILFDWRHG